MFKKKTFITTILLSLVIMLSVVLTGCFKSVYSVTIPTGEGYTISEIDNYYTAGNIVTFKITVTDPKKELASVTSEQVSITNEDGNCSFTMPAENVTVQVELKDAKAPAKYTVTVPAGVGYTVSGVNLEGYEAGEEVVFTVSVTDSEKVLESVTSEQVNITNEEGNYRFTMPAENVIVQVTLVAKKYKVDFYSDGETLFTTKYVESGKPVEEPETNPTKEGQTFRYWCTELGEEYDFSEPVTSDLRLEAKFGVHITFNLNGGTGDTPEEIWVKVLGMPTTLPTGDGITNGDKVFAGWEDLETKTVYSSGEQVTITRSVELFAKWEEPTITYTVEFYCGSYNNNGITGIAPETKVVNKGDKVILPANPWTREGYAFKGWKIQRYVDEYWKDIEGEIDKQQGYEYQVNENIRVTATWEQSKLTIKYDANGGSGEIASSTSKYGGKTIFITEEMFVAPAGKTFAGWSLTQNGEAIYVSSGTIQLDAIKDSLVRDENGNYEVTLYAIWKEAKEPVQVADIEGVWTSGNKTVVISTVVAGNDIYGGMYGSVVGSIIVNNEYMLLYDLQDFGSDYGFAAFPKISMSEEYSMEMVSVTYKDNQLTVNSDVYTSKTSLTNASKADFVGEWKRDDTSQILTITEDKVTISSSSNVTVFEVIDKYLVIEYNSAYQYLLTKNDNKLEGYYNVAEAAPKAVSFTKVEEVTPEKYTVTVSKGEEYTVSGLVEEGYEEGATVTFTVTVTDSKKALESVTSEQVEIKGTDGSYTFTMPKENVTIIVTLKDAEEQPDLPAGDLYNAEVKAEYSNNSYSFTIDKLVYDEEGMKIYIWGTVNGEKVEGKEYTLEASQISWYEGPGTIEKYWKAYICGKQADNGIAILSDGSIIFCDNQDAQIADNVYRKA